ncbi:MAG: glycosyltransferase [Actinomycetota bacterium]|nr:glycosyltransferase [Actinomycetota bacterium]
MVAPELLFYGGFPLGYHNREAERKALAFADAGYDVVYMSGIGVRDPRLRTLPKAGRIVAQRVHHRQSAPSRGPGPGRPLRQAGLTVVPPRRLRPLRRFNERWVERQLRGVLVAPDAAVAWIRGPTPELVEALSRSPPAVIVYECVDALDHTPGLAGTAWLKVFQRAERRLAGLADVVVATSPPLADRFRGLGAEVRLMAHGVDLFPWHPRQGRPAGPIVLGFVGSLDFRIDTPLLRTLATSRPDWQIRLCGVVGPGFDPKPLVDLPNVTIGPRVEHERLGEVLGGFDLGLLPYLDTPVYRHMNPLKNLELLAAGRAAVARPAPALDAFADVLYLARSPQEFIAQCDRALAEDSLARAHARRAIAERHTWDDRLAELVALLGDLRTRRVAT